MKKLFVSAAAIAVASVIATPASAAPTSGGRVEAIIGWDHNVVDLDDLGFDGDVDSDGVVFGLGVGYDFAVSPSTSVGIDLEATESTADIDFLDGTDSAELSVGRDLYVGGRFTAAVSPSTNLYVKAGYTNARIRGRTEIGGVVQSDSANADGFRVGAGAQFAITDNSYVGTEYRYSNYEGDFSRHQVVATLGFRF